MPIFAIAKQYLSVIQVNFEQAHSISGDRIINPKENFGNEDFLSLCNAENEEWLTFASLEEAKLAALFVSRLYSDDSSLIARQIQQFASAVIFAYEHSSQGIFSQIDADTLTLYPNFQTLPFYQFECFESERNYAMQILHAFKHSPIPLPRCRKQLINSKEPTEVIYQNAMGDFQKHIMTKALVLPFKSRFILAR